MRHYQRLFHQELCKPYEAAEAQRLFGTPEELHPLVQKMLRQTMPHAIRGDNYNQFIESMAIAAEKKYHKPFSREKLKDIISPNDLHHFMKKFAAGIQFAAQKTKKTDVKDFVFTSETFTKTEGGDMLAGYGVYRNHPIIIINPLLIWAWKTNNDEQFRKSVTAFTHIPSQFDKDEHITLIATEEMFHSYQHARDTTKLPMGNPGTVTPENYLNNPKEKEAKDFLMLAARELHLGSDFRHGQNIEKPRVHHL